MLLKKGFVTGVYEGASGTRDPQHASQARERDPKAAKPINLVVVTEEGEAKASPLVVKQENAGGTNSDGDERATPSRKGFPGNTSHSNPEGGIDDENGDDGTWDRDGSGDEDGEVLRKGRERKKGKLKRDGMFCMRNIYLFSKKISPNLLYPDPNQCHQSCAPQQTYVANSVSGKEETY